MDVIKHFEDVDRAVEVLRKGGIIIYPTETVYGIGCLASERQAIDRLAGVKDSGASASYIVLVRSRDSSNKFCTHITRTAEKLMEVFWPGPLTLILSARRELHPRLIGPTGGVAVRMCPNPWSGAILKRIDDGLISTSANLSGMAAPASFADLDPAVSSAADLSIDGGDLPGGVSTVLDLCGDRPVLLREGVITITQISEILDSKIIFPDTI